MPMMPFIGVRISWLMLARNWLLARLAASACFLGSQQLGLRPLALGDVAQDGLHHHSIPVAIGAGSELDVDRETIATENLPLLQG